MADKPEEIIIIEDSDAAQYDHTTEDVQSVIEEEEAKRKKIILFGGIGIIVVLIIAITIILFALKSSKEKNEVNINFINKNLQTSKKKPTIEPSKLENMIAKANYLYETGAKKKALALYEKIATYSEAISQYNLGVAQLKDKQYKIALKTFQKAIENDEKRCVSAINAAVCSLHLHDKENFHYYIDLAYAYLPYEIDSPLYSYYYTLISYYNRDYLAALSSLKNSTSQEYPTLQEHLSAKINALYGNDYDAIESMEKINNEHDDFALALLYARVGDFSLALNHLQATISKEQQPVRAPVVV